MNERYDLLTKKYQNDLIENLKKFISINSVYDEASVDEQNPFGKGVSKALIFFEELARKDGFIVTNYKNKIVEILVGSGDKNVTIMAHADVVPAASGWDNDPFTLVEKDGILYARGVSDDKGPALAAYYALKTLRDNNLLGNYKVRFLLGGNEESGSLGMEYYFHTLKKPQPTLGFSPDSDFPLIYGEKGIINFEIEIPFRSEFITSFTGGVAPNSVIEKFEINFIESKNISIDNSNVKYDIKKNKITFYGKAAHGSTPWEGENAALIGLHEIGAKFKIDIFNKIYNWFSPLKGEGVNCNFTSKDMGTCSLNLGMISYDENTIKIIINFRHVETITSDEIIVRFKEALKPYKVKVNSISPLLFYSLDNILVKTLLKAYQDETHDYDSKPMTTGGGTYAKEADNVIAFGMQFPSWDSMMHSPGERCRKDDLFKAMNIYARAIVELGKLIDENKI